MEKQNNILKPTDDYLMDVSDPNKKMVSKLLSDVRSLKQNTINSTAVPIKSIIFQATDLTQLTAQNPLIALVDGFFYTSFFGSYSFLPQVLDYKLANISDITLSLNLFAYSPDNTGYVAPGGISDFTIDFYLSLWLLPVITGNLEADLLSYTYNLNFQRAMCIKFTFNVFASTPLAFTVDSPNRNYRLSDVIADRAVIDGFPDFTTNPTKLTNVQYSQLLSSNTLVASMFGYDADQRTALSAANISLFDDLFNLGAGGFSLFTIGVEGSFNYSGIASSFIPI